MSVQLTAALLVVIIWTLAFGSYDVTVSVNVENANSLVNLNTLSVPIIGRSFIHISVQTRGGIYITFQTAGNKTTGSFLAIHVRLKFLTVMNCLNASDSKCEQTAVKRVQGLKFVQGEAFLLRLDWTQQGKIEVSSGKPLDSKGRADISRGGGPALEKIVTYDSNTAFPINIIAVGTDSADTHVDVTFARVLPHTLYRSVQLSVEEIKRIGFRIHKLSEFQNGEILTMVSPASDPGLIRCVNTYLVLRRKLRTFKKRSAYFTLTFRGDVLTLYLSIYLRIIHYAHAVESRKLLVLEELPVGTVMEDWIRIVDADSGDKVKTTMNGNPFFRMYNGTDHMTVVKRIDRDGRNGVASIANVVYLTDLARHKTRIKFYVGVVDINDNQPMFSRWHQRVNLVFNRTDTSLRLLTTFTVTDMDVNTPPGYRLHIVHGNDGDTFYLSGNKLYVRMKKLMDMRRLTSLGWGGVVVVKATDMPSQGIPLSSTSAVVWVVKQTEDAFITELPPLLLSNLSFHELSPIAVPEDTQSGHVVLRIANQTSLPFPAETNRYIFSLNSLLSACKKTELLNGYFRVDPWTGDVRVGRYLDADNETGGCDTFILVFNLTDIKTNITQTFSRVNITILERNDNRPMFDKTVMRCSEPCSHGDNLSLVALNVSDVDRNSTVSVTITEGDSNRYSVVRTGDAWSLVGMPRDDSVHGDVNVLVLQAEDDGKPPLSTTAYVIIEITCDTRVSNTTGLEVPPDAVAGKREISKRSIDNIMIMVSNKTNGSVLTKDSARHEQFESTTRAKLPTSLLSGNVDAGTTTPNEMTEKVSTANPKERQIPEFYSTTLLSTAAADCCQCTDNTESPNEQSHDHHESRLTIFVLVVLATIVIIVVIVVCRKYNRRRGAHVQ